MLAWLTPNVADLSAPDATRALTVPNELWPFVSGALYLLTLEHNWEQSGTATPEDMSQLFLEMLNNFNEITVGGTMNFITTSTHQLVSYNGSSANVVFPIYDADLPTEAQGASVILVGVELQRLTGVTVQQLRMSDQANKPFYTIYDTQNSEVTKGQYLLPMRSGGALFRLTGSGNTAFFEVDLLGWM